MDHFGITIFRDNCCIEYEKQYDQNQRASPLDTDDAYLDRIRQRRQAVCFLRRSNMQIYAPLMRELRDQLLHDMDIYPRTLKEAFSLLQHHSSGKRKQDRQRPSSHDVVPGVQHVQRGSGSQTPSSDDTEIEVIPGANGQVNARITC